MKKVILSNEKNTNCIASSMGCRTYNGYDINFNFKETIESCMSGNSISQFSGNQKDGRGNICPVTILMPFLAMEAKEKAIASGFGKTNDDCLDPISAFFEILDTKIHEAKDMLLERFEWICAQDPASANFMWDNHTMAGYIPEEGVRSALKHGTIVIGQLGLAETLQILIGCDHTTEKGMELAKRIEQLFKDRCAEFKQEYKLNFGVYYTPAENLAFTAMEAFKKKYGVVPNVSCFTRSIKNDEDVIEEMINIFKTDNNGNITEEDLIKIRQFVYNKNYEKENI